MVGVLVIKTLLLVCSWAVSNNCMPLTFLLQWDASWTWAEYQITLKHHEIASLQDGVPGGMTESRPPWVTNLQLEKMNWASGFVFLVLVFFVTSQTAGASQLNADGNYTETGNATDGGSVPAVFTSVSQIIAREGSCTLIDCNVTGDPFPSVQWFNSHGHRVDTSGEIDFFFSL